MQLKSAVVGMSLTAMTVVVLLTGSAQARSISERINLLYGDRGIEADVDDAAIPHRAHFTSASLATLGLLVKQVASSAADFPAISTVPGFTYRYNTQLQVFERSSTSLGSTFVERPQTIGQGKIDFGISYLFVDFEELNGKNLDRLSFRNLEHNDCCNAANPPPSPGVPAFEQDTADLFIKKFTLQSHVLSLSATYGITDHWDVNILLPFVFSHFKLRAQAVLNNESGTGTHSFDNATGKTIEARSTSSDPVGIGDLLLRTKYHLYEGNGSNFALGATLRLPTGEDRNFQGIGDRTLTPFFAASHDYGPVNLHLTSGIEFNFDDSDRSRVRYGAGFTFAVIEQLALTADFIGSSHLKKDRISVTVPQFVNAPGTSEATPTTLPTSRTFSSRVRDDIIDFVIGGKVNIYSSVVGYANVFIPLNDDGLRAHVIPAAGLEVSF
jgi:hypothetical protein